MTTLEKLCRAACEAEGRDPDDEVDVDDRRRAAFPISIVVREWEVKLVATKAILSALEESAEELMGYGWEGMRNEETYGKQVVGSFTAMIRKAKEG